MKILIPLKPLSVNAAWQGRRFKSKTYKKYEADIDMLVPPAKKTLKGLIHATYIFYLTNFLRTDGDNLVKCLQDLLVKKGYIEDDREIVKYTIEKHKSITNSITVMYEEVGE